jgi:hypothetical protein
MKAAAAAAAVSSANQQNGLVTTKILILCVSMMCYVGGTLRNLRGLQKVQYTTQKQRHEQRRRQNANNYLQITIPSDYRLPDYYTPGYDNYPSVELPFIYFHQRKTGGSTIRSYMKSHFIDDDDDEEEEEEESLSNNTSHRQPTAVTYIPCKTHELSCETYYAPSVREKQKLYVPTVYGGHLYYSSFLRTLRVNHYSFVTKINDQNQTVTHRRGPEYNPPKPKFTCFTLFRERKLWYLFRFLVFVDICFFAFFT